MTHQQFDAMTRNVIEALKLYVVNDPWVRQEIIKDVARRVYEDMRRVNLHEEGIGL